MKKLKGFYTKLERILKTHNEWIYVIGGDFGMVYTIATKVKQKAGVGEIVVVKLNGEMVRGEILSVRKQKVEGGW